MKRAAVALLTVLAAALLLAACGGGSGSDSSSTAPAGGSNEGGAPKATTPNAPAGSKVASCDSTAQLRATVVDCATAQATMEAWERSRSCAPAAGASRSSCSLGRFRCQAVQVDPGAAVSCVGPEGDVAFIVRSAG